MASQMVFPLGPELYLSWANCATRAELRRRKIHRLPVRAQARLQVLIVCKEDNLVSR